MKFEIVVWDDITTAHGWDNLDEVSNDNVDRCVTWGVVVDEDANRLVLASTLSYRKRDEVTEANLRIAIPLGAIVKRFVLDAPAELVALAALEI